jgi:hypothetical protein
MSEKNETKEEISEDELDQIIQDMSKDESRAPAELTKATLDFAHSKKKVTSSAVTPSQQTQPSQQSLSMEMNGVINLKLSFKNGGRSIEVHCTEEHLLFKMADGTEFKIPTGNAVVRKIA